MAEITRIKRLMLNIGTICLLVAITGGIIGFSGYPKLGWLIGITGAISANLVIVASIFIGFFGKYFKFIRDYNEKKDDK
jgi:hypothetical protein